MDQHSVRDDALCNMSRDYEPHQDVQRLVTPLGDKRAHARKARRVEHPEVNVGFSGRGNQGVSSGLTLLDAATGERDARAECRQLPSRLEADADVC